jgi:hypothetical protein
MHGSKLGREHTSLRQHLVEDHDVEPGWAETASDGSVHGLHDGRHRTIGAHDYDIRHPGDSPFQQHSDLPGNVRPPARG